MVRSFLRAYESFVNNNFYPYNLFTPNVLFLIFLSSIFVSLFSSISFFFFFGVLYFGCYNLITRNLIFSEKYVYNCFLVWPKRISFQLKFFNFSSKFILYFFFLILFYQRKWLNLPFWMIASQINLPSSLRSQALGNFVRWSLISVQPSISHRLLVSNPTRECLVDKPEWFDTHIQIFEIHENLKLFGITTMKKEFFFVGVEKWIAWNGTDLIVILHQLNDNSNIITIVFNGNDSHNIGSIFSIWILTILIG